MITREDIYFNDVASKLMVANELFRTMGPLFLDSPQIQQKLANLLVLSDVLTKQMASMTMFTLCRACGSKEGGGCCSAYMANETDTLLLLMNMLMGVAVKPCRDDSFECRYLGPQGCILKIKPIFCLNYNCQQILCGNDADVIGKLEGAAAAVLREQSALEEILLKMVLTNGR